jgi:hypothetical protein
MKDMEQIDKSLLREGDYIRMNGYDVLGNEWLGSEDPVLVVNVGFRPKIDFVDRSDNVSRMFIHNITEVWRKSPPSLLSPEEWEARKKQLAAQAVDYVLGVDKT